MVLRADTNYAAVTAGFEFRRNLPGGDEGAMAYAQALARWSGKRLSELWGTEVMGINLETPAWLTNIAVSAAAPFASSVGGSKKRLPAPLRVQR